MYIHLKIISSFYVPKMVIDIDMYPKLLMSDLKLLCLILSMNKGQQQLQTDVQTNPDRVFLFLYSPQFVAVSCGWRQIEVLHDRQFLFRERGALGGIQSLL